MVERSLSMREVPGSIPGASKTTNFSHFSTSWYYEIKAPRNNSPLNTHFYNMVWICVPWIGVLTWNWLVRVSINTFYQNSNWYHVKIIWINKGTPQQQAIHHQKIYNFILYSWGFVQHFTRGNQWQQYNYWWLVM